MAVRTRAQISRVDSLFGRSTRTKAAEETTLTLAEQVQLHNGTAVMNAGRVRWGRRFGSGAKLQQIVVFCVEDERTNWHDFLQQQRIKTVARRWLQVRRPERQSSPTRLCYFGKRRALSLSLSRLTHLPADRNNAGALLSTG